MAGLLGVQDEKGQWVWSAPGRREARPCLLFQGQQGWAQEGGVWERVVGQGVPDPLLRAPAAAHLGGLVRHRPGAACAEILQPRPGEEQDVLLGEQVRAPQGGDGTQGSLQGSRRSAVRYRQEAHLTGLPPSRPPGVPWGSPVEPRAHSPSHQCPR